jgi:uridine kinase
VLELTPLESVEPVAGGWTPTPVAELAGRLMSVRRTRTGPCLVAVDGRSAGGKTTLAASLAAAVPRAAVLHTDDLAWNEPLFEWAHLLRALLEQVRTGEPVRFQPPAWPRHGRTGAIEVPSGLGLVVVEGVGANDREVAGRYDAAVWVQSDGATARHRGIERDVTSGENGDRAQSVAFWETWDRSERGYLAEQRPWERSDVIVLGTPSEPVPTGHVVIAPGPLPQPAVP